MSETKNEEVETDKLQYEYYKDTLALAAAELEDPKHDEIAARVYRRLHFRHEQLRELETLAQSLRVHDEINTSWAIQNCESEIPKAKGNLDGASQASEEKSERIDNRATISPGLRAYHLAVTDLFVEKALAYLEDQANSYRETGKNAHNVTFGTFLMGAFLAFYQTFRFEGKVPNSWLAFASSFARSFTAWGMIVLFAVAVWRYGKAMLDQAERLMEKRHALRQGRLFVHLNDGVLSIMQMEKAFNWNVSQSNAFGDISAKAHAPWGAVTRELAKSIPALVRTGLEVATRNKRAEGEEKSKDD